MYEQLLVHIEINLDCLLLYGLEAVQTLIKQRFSISLAITTVGYLLKKWGFTPQKPVYKAIERNPKKINKWLEEEYPAIKERAKKEKAEIHWGVEMGLRTYDTVGRSYGRKGQTPVVSRTAKRIRCNMISTLTNFGKMRFMVFAESFTAKMFITFLGRLIRSCDKKVFLIVDNHKAHHATKVTQGLEKHKDKIEIFFLPPYAP